MKTIKSTTKKAQAFIESYNRSRYTSIYDCYTRPSTEKTRAEYFCREQMNKENGRGFFILSYNTFHFTAGWQTADGLRIETANSSYLITD